MCFSFVFKNKIKVFVMDSAEISSFLLENRNHQHLIDYLSDVYENESGFDLLVICSDNSKFKAHRLILAAASPYFHFLLKDLLSEDVISITMEYSGVIVTKLLEFCYKGVTTVEKDDEVMFLSLLTDMEIGSSDVVEVINPTPPESNVVFMDIEDKSKEVAITDSNLKCKICGQVLKTKTGLRLHLAVHEGSKANTCEVCGKGFSQASQLKTHMRTHTGEKPYLCSICNKSFSHASTLAEHTNLHNSLKPFQCNICLQSFAQRKGLRAHRCSSNQEVDPQSANQFFPCPYCNRQFSSRRGLAIHKMHQHLNTESLNEPILTCDSCADRPTFTNEASFEEHLASHMYS